MNRRMWTAILAGVLAATVVLGVAGVAYNAGQRAEVVTRTVGDGEVVRVVGHGWAHGPGGGFFLFPVLLTFLLVFLLVRAFRGGHWGGGGGHGDWFEERHRRAHASTSDVGEA